MEIKVEIKDFIKKNSYFIYEYINTSVLKNIGIINPDYFVKIIQDIFEEENKIKLSELNANSNILPYSIFTLLSDNGKMDYTSLRVETIDFSQLNKESSTYYNYARFSLKDDFLCIELMQSKIGGMPIDDDIVKFTKSIAINSSAFKKFIIKKEKDVDAITSKEQYKKINEAIKNIF